MSPDGSEFCIRCHNPLSSEAPPPPQERVAGPRPEIPDDVFRSRVPDAPPEEPIPETPDEPVPPELPESAVAPRQPLDAEPTAYWNHDFDILRQAQPGATVYTGRVKRFAIFFFIALAVIITSSVIASMRITHQASQTVPQPQRADIPAPTEPAVTTPAAIATVPTSSTPTSTGTVAAPKILGIQPVIGVGTIATVTISGSGLYESMAVYLEDSTHMIECTARSMPVPNSIVCQFDLQDEPAGTYSLTIEGHGGSDSTPFYVRR